MPGRDKAPLAAGARARCAPAHEKSGPQSTDDAAEDFHAAGDLSGSYDDWTVADLRRRAKQLGLTGYSGKKKASPAAMLRDH